jgi:hypothetical protein
MDLDIAGQILSRHNFRQNKIGGVVMFAMVRSGEVMRTHALFGAVRYGNVWLGNVRQGDSWQTLFVKKLSGAWTW